MLKKKKRTAPVHPGELLREDLMKPLGLTITGLARDLKIPASRVSEIVNGRRALNADAALRLSRYFGNTPKTNFCCINSFMFSPGWITPQKYQGWRPKKYLLLHVSFIIYAVSFSTKSYSCNAENLCSSLYWPRRVCWQHRASMLR